ncbi:DUF4249 domain-containing protein [Seonamhaeicola algicola]|uniref:DUF4249 domain-containing protein n=1 Tax=Seonamhaeicola algicola TaxID=1719036 RepID=A0A5C7B2J0_9FLAO|nr:DUF4249 domain-containing protein [Seonamhaeicola algicola]TXE13959.1 DUF4249 domain-containing protein [Seonamhaeicola algicola]
MKKIIILLSLFCLMFSCEDVIDVDLESVPPRLVIDATLSWEKGTTGNEQEIKLSLTAPYFDVNIPPATGASVTVTDTDNNTFIFNEELQGLYKNYNFVPQINMQYTLTVIYENQTYIATETLIPVVPIDFVEQNDNGGFSGEDIEIKAYYTDPSNQENYYLFEFGNDGNMPTLEVYDDEFNNGNQIFGFYVDEDLKKDDLLRIKLSGISQRCYNYIFVLLQQTDDETGDPFETQPATVRGNCINETNPENYPLGYFRVTETDVFTYTVQ